MKELTIKQFSTHFDLSVSGVKYWIKQGKIKSRLTIVRGRQTRLIPQTELDRMRTEQSEIVNSFEQGNNGGGRPDGQNPTDQAVSLVSPGYPSVLSGQLQVIESKLDNLRIENDLLKKQLLNGHHWQPWRDIIRITGEFFLSIITRIGDKRRR